MTHPPTIREVARRAGVSTATVGRVLAGVGRPRPETVSFVLAAVDSLGYRPSGVARSLRMRRTATVGLVIADIQNPFLPELVQAADVAARGLGYSIILANAEPGSISAPVVTSDNRGGAVLAVEHLVALGHRRIAFIGGPATFTAALPRLEGFRAACRAAGLAEAETPVFPGEGTVESGELAAARIVAEAPRATGIVCYNDLTAIGVLRALRAAGIGVPGQVSVVGFDDISAASWVAPALTTICQQKAEMGRLAIECLAAMLGGKRDSANITPIRLPTRLIVRESTGVVPSEPGEPG